VAGDRPRRERSEGVGASWLGMVLVGRTVSRGAHIATFPTLSEDQGGLRLRLMGRYPSLLMRILGLRLVPSSPHLTRLVSYEFMNRQLVWGAFTVRRMRRISTQTQLLPLLTLSIVHDLYLLPLNGTSSDMSRNSSCFLYHCYHQYRPT
jgi:hypothetical protein